MPKKGIKRRLRKARPYKKRGQKVSMAIKKYVKAAISRKAETKSTYVQNAINFGSILESPDLNLAPILWYPSYHTLSIGASDGNRLGNKVTIKKVYLRYTLNCLGYDAITNPNPLPVHVQLFLIRLKGQKNTLPPDVSRIYNLGGSAFANTGGLVDLNASLNTDLFQGKIWSHKLGFANYAGSGGLLAQQTFANNDFPLNIVKRLDITRMFQKTALFDDSSQAVINGNYFFGYQSIAATNSVTGSTILNTRINYSIEIQYEDM